MKLYKLSQDINNDYNTYESAIVAAETPEQALSIHPDINGIQKGASAWAELGDLKIELIGEAKEGTKAGVILASYNAG